MTDQLGNLLWYGEYTAWGRLKIDERVYQHAHQPFRLQNQYCDEETGLHYNLMRYYEPDSGRFVNQDPIHLVGGDNLYWFAPNAQAWVDSSGLCPESRRSYDARSAANGAKLREHLRQQERYGRGRVRELPDGRFRYYGELREARTPGEMAGMRPVREWNPNTGQKRTWMETIDHKGNVRIVRPQESITHGQKIHYCFDVNGKYKGTKEGITRRDIRPK